MMYIDFYIIFFMTIYDKKIEENNIDIENELNIINFYYLNKNELKFINKKVFFENYPNIDLYFIHYVYLGDEYYNETNIIQYFLENENIYQNPQDLINEYKNFNFYIFLNYYNYKINDFNQNNDIYKFLINNKNCIYSIDQFFKEHIDFDINVYKNYYQINNLKNEQVIIHYLKNKSSNIIKNKKDIQDLYNFEFIKIANNIHYTDEQFINIININSTFITKLNDFKNIYLNKLNYLKKDNIFLIDIFNLYQKKMSLINSISKLLNLFKKELYELDIHKNSVGLKYIFSLNEVIQDLSLKKPKLKNGISLIIRAKNEEINVKICIESVIDLVDEIIFVNNNSNDKTGYIAEELSKKYKHLKVYHYFLDVNKVGKQHQEAIKKGDKNTLGNYYNWCLSKATYINVIKWDADFICIRENFKQMINNYELRTKNENFALWFTGLTMFIHKNTSYININSFYNEYRIFSYQNQFQWYDGDYCEYTEPYLNDCRFKYRINYPIFYEMKNTSLNEFESRSSLLDSRDQRDFELIELLKKNKIDDNNLIKIQNTKINQIKHVILFTNNLGIGGSNLFIIELYYYLKYCGFYVYIVLDHLNEQKNLFKIINEYDIYLNHDLPELIKSLPIDYYLCNGFLPPYVLNNLEIVKKKIIFISHSDVAYSNFYIKEYYKYFYKIITVNQYTKLKLLQFLNIDSKIIYQLPNFKINTKSNNNFIKKKYIFGIISRFSEDKNIIMLLFSLKNIFNQEKYQHYLFYLVGSENNLIDDYIKTIIDYLGLSKYIIFKGFQDDIQQYYELFDFIVLPSVSEGCSYNILESMFYEKIMVLSEVGGNYELFPQNSCVFIQYDGIRDFEKEHLYIENYHGQLKLLGYYIHNNIQKNDIIDDFKIHHHYYSKIFSIPSILLKNHDDLKLKWYNHEKKIEQAIIKAMDMELSTINNYTRINKLFYEKNFNKKKYYETLDNIFS